MQVRPATAADAASLARIYNQGIEDRTATFETEQRSDYEVLGWFDGVHPIVAVEDGGEVIAFARASEYRPRAAYRGVFEFAVYTERSHRRRGAARLALRELVTRARDAGAWKLVARIFVENEASRALVAGVGFREVGTYHRHAKLDDRWRDVVIVEKFLAPIGPGASLAPPAPRGTHEDVVEQLRSPTIAPEALERALEWARGVFEGLKRADRALLDAVFVAFARSKHDATARSRFVDLFRHYAAISPDASRELFDVLTTNLEERSQEKGLDAFYELGLVMKQLARPADLAPHCDRLLGFIHRFVDLPPGLLGRISPGNVISLLMPLALAACGGEDDKRRLAELAADAKTRHRVETPALVRAAAPPAAPPARTSIPPPLPIALESEDLVEIVEEPPPPSKKKRAASAAGPKKRRSRKKKTEE